MNPMIRDPFATLQQLINQPLFASLSNNSLLLLFEIQEGARISDRQVLRVNHPWKLLFNSSLVGESREFFSVSDVDAGLPVDWDHWSRDFANWVPGKLTGLSIGVDRPDLRLVFQSSHVLEAISEDVIPADWTLQHHKGAEIMNANTLVRFPWGELFLPELHEK